MPIHAIHAKLQVGVPLVEIAGTGGVGRGSTSRSVEGDLGRHAEEYMVVGDRQSKSVELDLADPFDHLAVCVLAQPCGVVGGIGRHVPVEEHDVVCGDGCADLVGRVGTIEGEHECHRVDTLAQVAVLAVQRLGGEICGHRLSVARKRHGPDPESVSAPSVDEFGDQGVLAGAVESLDGNELTHERDGNGRGWVDPPRRGGASCRSVAPECPGGVGGPVRFGASSPRLGHESVTIESMKPRILVVDDDAALAEMLTIVLRGEGFEPFVVGDGTQALTAVREIRPDLVLLDLMLPGMNGIDVCRVLRADSGVPIVMLTAKSDTVDVVLGLESGADDYMVKPFKPKELVARVRARLRRTDEEPAELLSIGPVEIDVPAHKVTRDGVPISLTPLEFDLLVALARKPRQVFTRDVLLEQVWGYRHPADTRLVNVHVQRLRAKVETDPENPEVVLTVRGVGYKAGPP